MSKHQPFPGFNTQPKKPASAKDARLADSGPTGRRRADLLERYDASHSHATLRDLQLATLDCLRRGAAQ